MSNSYERRSDSMTNCVPKKDRYDSIAKCETMPIYQDGMIYGFFFSRCPNCHSFSVFAVPIKSMTVFCFGCKITYSVTKEQQVSMDYALGILKNWAEADDHAEEFLLG